MWRPVSQGRKQAAARRRVDVAADIAAATAGSADLDRLLADALRGTMRATGFEVGVVLLTGCHGTGLEPVTSSGVAPGSIDGLGHGPPEGDPLHEAMRGAVPLPVDDVPSVLPALGREGVRTCVAAPLRSRGSSLGVLLLGTRGSRRPVADDLRLLTAVGDLLGVAVDNACLHREAERKVRVQARLNELAEQIVSEFEIDTIAGLVVSGAKELTGADGAGVALGDREGDRGFCTVGFPPYPTEGPIRVERAVDGEVMRTGRPVIVDDYPSSPGASPALVAAGLANLIAVPIVYGEQHVFGVLTLFHTEAARRFTDADLAVAVDLGRQTGIAMENAQLYQSTSFYVRQVTRAQEDERMRIARELHDETIQTLVVVSRRLEGLSVLSDQLPAAAQERITALQELLTETIGGVRRFVQDLRPPMLDHLGLVASVEALAGDLRENHGIKTLVRVTGTPRRLEPEEELVLFRIVQEAMGNTRRHSAASRVEVHMEFEPDYVRVIVSDDGCGFTVPKRIDAYVSEEKLGLVGMKERARMLGGTLDIRSEPGLGTRVTVQIPSERPTELEMLQVAG